MDRHEKFGWSHIAVYDEASPIFNNRRYPEFALNFLMPDTLPRAALFRGDRTAFSRLRASPAGNLSFYTSSHFLLDLICNCIRRTDWLEITRAPYDRFFLSLTFTRRLSVNPLCRPRLRKHCGRHFVLPDHRRHVHNIRIINM